MAIDKKAYSKTRYPSIKVNRDGIRFWFDFWINDKRYSKIFKSNPVHGKADRLKSAHAALEAFKSEILRAEALDENVDQGATVNDYWKQLLRVKANVWSDAHAYKMKGFYKLYIKGGIGKKKIKEVKPSDLTRFNITISHLATRSQKVAYECLIPIFSLAIEDEIIMKSPIKQKHRPVRKAIEEKKIITNAVEASRAVNAAIHKVFSKDPNDDKSEDRYDLMALFLFCFHGRRWGETTKLKWENIDFDDDSYTVPKDISKVNVDMSFTLPGEVKEALSKFSNKTGDIFPVKRVERYFDDIRAEEGVPKEFTIHWLRNLYVSTLAELGVDAIHLSGALGHTDTNTVKQYLSLQRKSATKTTTDAMEKLLNEE